MGWKIKHIFDGDYGCEERLLGEGPKVSVASIRVFLTNASHIKARIMKRTEVPELEKMIQYGRKKFVRYDEGAKMYSMGLHTFQELAKDAGTIYRVKRIVLVNTELIDEYMETFHEL